MDKKVKNIDMDSKKRTEQQLQEDLFAFRGWAAKPAYRQALEKYAENPTVMLELNSRCNFHCHYCLSPESKRQKSFMAPELFRHLLPQLHEVTSHPIRLHLDGEPTLHPQFLELALEANAAGHRICLATNASNLQERFLSIDMDMVVNLSCSAEELRQRTAMGFDKYIGGIERYVSSWAAGDSQQNLIFRIYTSANERNTPGAVEAKQAFAEQFVEQVGLAAAGAWSAGEKREFSYAKAGGGMLSLAIQPLAEGGLYPNISGLPGPEPTAVLNRGFCDSAWKVLVVMSDGTLGCCCVDLTGQTGFTDPDEIWSISLKDLWLKHPKLLKFREDCLAGRIGLSACQTCLGTAANRELYIFPELFPFPEGSESAGESKRKGE